METHPLTILSGDVLEQLRTLPDGSVHCCVTSPPYWGLRDYGTAQWDGGTADCQHRNITQGNGQRSDRTQLGEVPYREECGKCGAKRIDSQLGLEKTPEEYVAKMVGVFREVRRVLRKDGTLWLNLGDSYASASACDRRSVVGNGSPDENCKRPNRLSGILKEKDLCGIPWRVAFALQADGWWLRSDIIWAKPNPMPESVTDRPTKSHEYLFLLTKSANYFYDAEAIREPIKESQDGSIRARARTANGALGGENHHNIEERFYDRICGANKRSVWTVATAPYPEAHFATYPPDLIKPCILAGTSAKGCCAKCGSPFERQVERPAIPDEMFNKARYAEDSFVKMSPLHRSGKASGQKMQDWLNANPYKTTGWKQTCICSPGFVPNTPTRSTPCTVLDPFAGSGTTGAVALELGRKAILIELNPKYVELINQRCNVTMGLALA